MGLYPKKKKNPYPKIIQPLVILPQCSGTENNKSIKLHTLDFVTQLHTLHVTLLSLP
jgi:hypothetical protein